MGCFGDALGRLLGASEASWEALGGVWGLWGRLWVLRGRLREALGCFQSISERLLGAPETPWGASRGAFGTSREASWGSESVGSGQDAKVKTIVFLKEFIGFRGPGGSESKPKSSRSGFEGPRGACGSGFERLWESGFEKSGPQAAEISGPQRKSAGHEKG